MSSRPIELAMTHRVGANGHVERCLRPPQVRDTAERLMRWAGAPEMCAGCKTRHAVRMMADAALCGFCHIESSIRIGLDVSGRQAPSLRAEDDATGVQFRGLSIVFDSKSVDMGFYEFMRPSSVDRTIAEGIDVRALWSHNADLTIGRQSAGTLRLRKVSQGLAVEIDPPRWASGYVESVQRRDVTGQSFAFETVEDSWWMEDGYPHREILDARIYEVSAVSWPAYPRTTLAVTRSDARSEWTREQETAERLRLAR
jgi:HK97 family phage prohead protease